MKTKRWLTLTFCALMTFVMSVQGVYARRNDFASRLKADVLDLQKESDKDPEAFKDGIRLLEEKYADIENPVERSVAHAMLASCYQEMSLAGIADYDGELCELYVEKQKEHLSHVLDNASELADVKVSAYAPIFLTGDDDVLYHNDMLAALARYVGQAAGMRNRPLAIDAYAKAKEIYRKRGNMNGYALMKMKWLSLLNQSAKAHGGISERAVRDSLHALLIEVKNYEVGADVALGYYEAMAFGANGYRQQKMRDEQILFLKWALENVASSKKTSALKQELGELLRPRVEADVPAAYVAGKPMEVSVGMWNSRMVTLTVRRYAGMKKLKNGSEELVLTGDVIARREVEMVVDSANAERLRKGLPQDGKVKAELTLPAGRFVLVAEAEGEKSVQRFHVSSMCVLASVVNDSLVRYVVADNETGRPVKGVKVVCAPLRNQYSMWNGLEGLGKDAKFFYTDDEGSVCIAEKDVWAVKSDDDFTNMSSPRVGGNYGYTDKNGLKAQLMTDRSIYRPGQTIKAGLIAYNQNDDMLQVAVDEELTLVVSLAGKRDTLQVVTNALGSASFDYVLPADASVGTASIEVRSGKKLLSHSYVRVEEYKRPTFEVKLEGDRQGAYGQIVNVKGVAEMFAGVPVQGADVSYSVECRPMMRWHERWELVDDDELSTDDDGCFILPVELTDRFTEAEGQPMEFRVSVQVTDVAGETHEAEWNIFVGKPKGRYVVADGKYMVDLAGDVSLTIDAYDVNNKKVEVESCYRLLGDGQLCSEGLFVSGRKFELPKSSMFPGVTYTLVVTPVDSSLQMAAFECRLGTYDSLLPLLDLNKGALGTKVRKLEQMKEDNVLYAEKLTYKEGEDIDFYFSTHETDALVYLNVVSEHGLLGKYAVVTDGSMKHVRLPYMKEWGENVVVDMMYVRNGKAFFTNASFTLAEPDKRLALEWKTFRNRLEPGQKEEWTLTVKDGKGKPVDGAEMMAVLYDASLDRVAGHSWSFAPHFYRGNLRSYAWGISTRQDAPSFMINGKVKVYDVAERSFASFVPFEHDRFLRTRMYKSNRMLLSEVAVGVQKAEAAMASPLDGAEESEDAVASSNVSGASGSTADEQDMRHDSVKMRSNFAETAFFLPHLVSDACGDVKIAFSLPESLTEWRFMGLAHTKNVNYGYMTDKATARRTLMLRPNMPRFLRQGDKALIAASVVNMGEADLEGSVLMRLLDAATGEVVLSAVRDIVMPAGKTSIADFAFDVLNAWTSLDCEITVASGDKGDGERNPLPVLPAKRLVAETVPFCVKAEGNASGADAKEQNTVAEVDLTGLFNRNSPSADSRSMTVEYMDGPAWMCIEALKSVKNPESNNAISWSASLAANGSLQVLLKSFPVMDKYENSDSLRIKVAEAEKKLASLQKACGGWAWFKGMEANLYVTLAVCENLVGMSSPSPVVVSMLDEGVAYLDSVMLGIYKDKKSVGSVGNDILRYLSVAARAQQGRVGKEVAAMRKAYASRAEKCVDDLTIYGMARTASMLRDCGKAKVADRLVKVLKNYTVTRPGLGRFYATDAAYYSWMDYKIPTQLAAMKAIMQRDKNDAYLPDMLLWIIAQKQVQKWDNPMTAVEVARMLMEVLPMDNLREVNVPVISVDGNAPLKMLRGMAGAGRTRFEKREPELALEGCVTASVPEAALADGVKTLRVEKASRGVSWGAVHVTYSENADSLKSYGAGQLGVSRKCYVQRGGAGEWLPCAESCVLKVGDKVRVRHIVTADRDMDFVKVESQYPACFEPVSQLSGYRWMGGRGGFLSVHDSCVSVFFDWFTRGTSTIDVEYYVARAGNYGMGVATVECEYAKQYGGHTEGVRVSAEK